MSDVPREDRTDDLDEVVELTQFPALENAGGRGHVAQNVHDVGRQRLGRVQRDRIFFTVMTLWRSSTLPVTI